MTTMNKQTKTKTKTGAENVFVPVIAADGLTPAQRTQHHNSIMQIAKMLEDDAKTPETKQAVSTASQETAVFHQTTDSQKRHVRKRCRQLAMLLEAMSEDNNITRACKTAKLSHSTAYDLRKAWPMLREIWDKATELAMQRLEGEMYRRATIGNSEPVVSKGEIVAYKQVYSDNLAMFLSKAHRPDKYRDNVRVDVSGHVGIHYHVSGVERAPAIETTADEIVEAAALPDSKAK